MSDLPVNVSYGTVVGKFIKAVGDTADAGVNPDAVAASGTVTFTAEPARMVNATASPPVTIFPAPVVCTLNASGILIDPQAAVGVNLIATNDPDLNPTNWTYNVTVELTGLTAFSFDMALPAGTTVDLATVVPVEASGGDVSETIPVEIPVALSDEVTTITTGIKAVIHPPYAFTLTGYYAELGTPSTSGVVTVDLSEGAGAGTSVLGTKLTIDANEETSATAAAAATITDSAIAANARLSLEVDTAGTGAKGLKVWLLGTRPV